MTENNEEIFPNYIPNVGGVDYLGGVGTITVQYRDGEKSCHLFELFDRKSDFSLLKTDETIKFHVGQSYTKETAKTLMCSICDGTEFNVGQGDYFTAIKCVNCQWEMCIHDG